MTAHSYLGASSAHRWGHCPGSAVLSEGRPDKGNAAAARGTHLHGVAEDVLRNKAVETPADAMEVQPYTSWVIGLGGHTWLEQRVYYGGALGVDDDIAYGTADCINLSADGSTLTVGDLKTGSMRVDPVGNPQLALYAIGAMRFLDMLGHDMTKLEKIILVIVQPCLSEQPQAWETDVFDIQRVASTLAVAAKLAVQYRGDSTNSTLPLTPDEDACRWCRAAASCPKLAAVVENFTPPPVVAAKAADFKAVVPKGKPLQEHYKAIPLLRIWCDAIEEEMRSATMRGEPTGHKFVEGRLGNRRWVNNDVALDVLSRSGLDHTEYLQPTKLKSPAQLDKVLKAHPEMHDVIDPLVERPQGKPTLVPESDPRPKWVEDRAGNVIETFKKNQP